MEDFDDGYEPPLLRKHRSPRWDIHLRVCDECHNLIVDDLEKFEGGVYHYYSCMPSTFLISFAGPSMFQEEICYDNMLNPGKFRRCKSCARLIIAQNSESSVCHGCRTNVGKRICVLCYHYYAQVDDNHRCNGCANKIRCDDCTRYYRPRSDGSIRRHKCYY